MQPVPTTPMEALEVFRSPDSEEWEREYAAVMITRDDSPDEALPYLVATLRDPNVSEALQQTVAGCLAVAWRQRGMLFTADISGFPPVARAEILAHRAVGPT